MSIWSKLKELAKNMGMEAVAQQADFSKINSKIKNVDIVEPTSSKVITSWDVVDLKIEALPEYEYILEAINMGCPAIFVTGKAGTGKSTFITWLQQRIDNCVIVAPTAIAALSIHGITIHSFFGFPISFIDPDDLPPLSSKKALVLENLKYLIIDEVSMVPPNMVDAIDNILKDVRGSQKPFGGIPVIFVGDLLQLSPVVSDKAIEAYLISTYGTIFFFSANVFKAQKLISVELKQVKRQNESDFLVALSHIRKACDYREHLGFINRECYLNKDWLKWEGGIVLVPTKIRAQQINHTELDRLSGEQQVFVAVIEGDVPFNKWRAPAPTNLNLKVGAKVIFVKNNKPTWINGDTGEVVGINKDFIKIRLTDTIGVIEVGRTSWEKYKYSFNLSTKKLDKELVGRFTQFPLQLGWAITIHKSQGMTLKSMKLDLGEGAFCEGQTYVALSRVKSLSGLGLQHPIKMGDVRANPVIIDFYKNLFKTEIPFKN